MASFDTLPPDQRAVLQLVLQRGRSYGEIAQVLSIGDAAVRQRALAALEALGPSTRIPADRREEISDYLLGQLPPAAAERARNRIAVSPLERAWARVVASELTPLAATALPEIPTEARADDHRREPTPEPGDEPTPTPPPDPADEPTPTPPPGPADEPTPTPPPGPADEPTPTPTPAPEEQPAAPAPPPARPTSRRGGAIILVAGALVAVAVVVVVIVLVAGSGGSNKHETVTAAATKTTTAKSTSTTSTPTARPIAQVNLVSPKHSKKTVGIAEIIRQGTKTGLVIVAQGIPANTSHDAYAVWLYNSQADSHILGFVNPGVKTDGKLQTAGALPSNAAHFKQLLVTRETQAQPHGPGTIILEGALGLSR